MNKEFVDSIMVSAVRGSKPVSSTVVEQVYTSALRKKDYMFRLRAHKYLPQAGHKGRQ